MSKAFWFIIGLLGGMVALYAGLSRLVAFMGHR